MVHVFFGWMSPNCRLFSIRLWEKYSPFAFTSRAVPKIWRAITKAKNAKIESCVQQLLYM